MTPVPGSHPTPGVAIDAHFLLGGHPDATALVGAEGAISYAALAAAVTAAADELGPHRQVVLLEARNDVRTVVTYLAALAGGHPVLLVAPDDLGRHAEVVDRFRPGIAALTSGTTTTGHSPPALHEDLAVLLSTSGSTGSPKLVRLSRANVESNARSIAAYLGIRPDDRAITSLPLHYCYGLSVLTSHLVAGASVVLSELSVSDEGFWALAAAEHVSSFAGVPYTFDLLDASGFAERDLPHLRYVTQAGGRMSPDVVTRYAELGRRHGWDLWVMYGQTEATARIAYLPPDLTEGRPTAVGVPVPGGTLRLRTVPGLEQAPGEPETGELVYAGPNVMMGYATGIDDLARGPELAELRTGDLARRAPDGLWEVLGRLDRHAKVFGLRLDLERIEGRLLDSGRRARVLALDDTLQVFLVGARAGSGVRRQVALLAGLPTGAVRVHLLEQLPTTPAGKCDDAQLRRHAQAQVRLADPAAGAGPDSLRDLFAVALGRADADGTDSFISLGGDSLSYVEISTRLSERLGRLPMDWPSLSIDDLARRRARRRRFTTPVEITVALRAVATVMILISHTDIALVTGGAHILLAVAGYNLARFTLAPRADVHRSRRVGAAMASVAVPAAIWIAGSSLLTGQYRPATALFLNAVVGSEQWTPDWRFWFLEALVWSYLGVAALIALPLASRLQQRDPFAFAMAVLVATLSVRYLLVGVQAEGTEKYAVPVVAWVVALGWAAFEARTQRQRLLVATTAVVGFAGFFGERQRELLVVVAVALLLWGRPVLLPRAIARCVTAIAAASLWIYLTQWQVYPPLEAAGQAPAAVLASLVVGIVAARLYAAIGAWTARAWAARGGRVGVLWGYGRMAVWLISPATRLDVRRDSRPCPWASPGAARSGSASGSAAGPPSTSPARSSSAPPSSSSRPWAS